MKIVTNDSFNSPYPDSCPAWCRKGALVRRTLPKKDFFLGTVNDSTVYEITDIHRFDSDDAKGIWGLAYLRPKGTEGHFTCAEYICDLTEATDIN